MLFSINEPVLIIMINWKKTELKYGYKETHLFDSSVNKVICDCDNCPRDFEISYSYFVKKYKTSQSKTICQKCSHRHRKETITEKTPIKKHQIQILPPQVDLFLTMEKFGYDGETLSPWSRNKIVLKCGCGKFKDVQRCALNLSKSVIETGNFKCVGCCTKERRTGAVTSDLTKMRIKKSHQKRSLNKNKEKEVFQPAANGDTGLVAYKDNNLLKFPKK